MKSLEKFLIFLFPTWMIINPNHLKKYNDQEVGILRTIMSFVMPASIVVYIGHYFFLDLPMNLQPRDLWFNYRFGISGLCLVTFLFYRFHKFLPFIPLKLPGIITGFTICYFQTKTIIWYPEVPYLYSFLFMVITSFCLRLSSFQAVLYISSIYALSWPIFAQTDLQPHMVHSAFFVTVLFSLILSSLKYFQTKIFLANETIVDQQRKNIEQNLEFTQTLKSFLPRKISKRLDAKVANQNLSIHQAVDEVLRPRSIRIACLSCDIRGYTKASKENRNYIKDSVIPLTQKESTIVEENDGIPRKIGDLLFCYFDSQDLIKNIISSNIAAISIAIHEAKANKSKNDDGKIRKQILIAAGEAYVGNIGGVNSAIEITAMGTPVNFLSRLESVVKSDDYINEIPRDHIIISKEVKLLLETLSTKINFNKHSPHSKNIFIKDFPEVNEFYSYQADEHILKDLNNLMGAYYKHSTRIAA